MAASYLNGSSAIRSLRTLMVRCLRDLFEIRRRPATSRCCRSSMRRGRTAIFWAIAAFALLSFGYPAITNHWPMMRDVEYGDKLANLRHHLARKPQDQPSIVMFVSSLTGWGFRPSSLETVQPNQPGNPVVFNCALNSSGIIVDLMILNRVLNSGIRPNLVILETHPQYLFTAYNTVPGEHFLQVWRIQKQDLEIMKKYDLHYHTFHKEWKEFQRFPWYTQRYELQNYLVPRWGRRIGQTDTVYTWNDKNGWEYVPSAITFAESFTRERIVDSIVQRIQGLNSLQTEQRYKDAYRDFISTCQSHGVPVVLVRMPETTYSLSTYKPELKREIDEFYNDLTESMNVRLIDASGWVGDAYFPDGFHMRPEGADIFTKRLEKEFLADYMKHPEVQATRLH